MADGPLAPYDLSHGGPPFTRCPSCKVDWKPTIWLLLDLEHRPDLRAAVDDDSLGRFRCEHCGTPNSVNSPLLVIRAYAPRLIFVPSPGTTSLEDHNQLVHALGMLRIGLSDLWDDALFSEVNVVPRPMLRSALTLEPTYTDRELLISLASADTGWKQQYLLGCHAEVYRPGVAAALEEQIEAARTRRDLRAAITLGKQRGLLENCRRAGMAEVQKLLPTLQVYDVTGDLAMILLDMAQAIRDKRRGDAVDAMVRVSRSLDKSDNPLLWTEVEMLIAEYSAKHKATSDSATQAYEAVAAAGFRFGPWLALSAEAKFRLAEGKTSRSGEAARKSVVQHLEASIADFGALGDDGRRAQAYDTLGYFHYSHRVADRSTDVLKAIECFEAAAACIDKEGFPDNWAAMQFNVGNAYLELETGNPIASLALAVHFLEVAASVQKELGNDERLRHTLQRLELARVKQLQASMAADPRAVGLHQALHAVNARDWTAALKAYRSVIKQTERMLAEQYTEEKRREVFSDFGTAYAAAAYVCFRLGRFEEGLALVEAGRSRVLTEEVEAFDVDTTRLEPALQEKLEKSRDAVRLFRATKMIATGPEHENSRDEVSHKLNRSAWTALKAVMNKVRKNAPEAMPAVIGERQLLDVCPRSGALVLPVFSVAGCCVLVVPHGSSSLARDNILWIDDFNDNDLIKMSVDWNKSQSLDDRAQRREAIPLLCERLWVRFCSHIAEKLTAFNIAPGASVVILPQGGLGLLPISAASATPHSGGSLLDVYAVSYAPSLYLLSLMQRRAADSVRADDSFVGIIDPLNDLVFGRAEGTSIATLFAEDKVALLVGERASEIRVRPAVVGKKYVHLSCHAYFTSEGGNFAGLYLAHDVVTSSRESLLAAAEHRPELDFFLGGQRWIVAELDLAACRLVTMSACESGKSDISRPDEFLGLPAALIRAGAAAVIGTMWRVDDIASMLLVHKLYEAIVVERLGPASALRQAQRWLRDATNETLVAIYTAMDGGDSPPLPRQRLQRELRRHALGSSKDRPFSHPYYWASFVVFGSER